MHRPHHPRRLRALLSGLVLLCGSTVSAASDADHWEFSLTPYLWAAGITGNVAAGGSEAPPIDPDYNFFALDNLQAALFIGFGARKGQWSFNTDFIHIGFSDDYSLGPLGAEVTLDADALELSAGYRLNNLADTQLVVGVRGISIDAGIVLTPGPDGADGKTWWDPIVGLQHHRSFGEHWGMLLRGDIGGFNVASKITVNGLAAATYRFNNRFTMLMGYRYLGLDFKDGDFVTDLEVYGYAIGLNFRW